MTKRNGKNIAKKVFDLSKIIFWGYWAKAFINWNHLVLYYGQTNHNTIHTHFC